jgi:hypothetical protein
MKNKRIGFCSYDEKHNETTKEKSLSPNELFSKLIEDKYTPSGERENVQLKTSSELIYEYREICLLSIYDISNIMIKQKFNLKSVNEQNYWVMYTKEIVQKE